MSRAVCRVSHVIGSCTFAPSGLVERACCKPKFLCWGFPTKELMAEKTVVIPHFCLKTRENGVKYGEKEVGNMKNYKKGIFLIFSLALVF